MSDSPSLLAKYYMFTKNNEPTKSKVRHWDRNTPCEWFDLTDYSSNCYNWAIIQVKYLMTHCVFYMIRNIIGCKKYALIKKIRNWTSAHFYTFSVRDWVRPETAAVLHFSFYINTLVPLDYTPVNQNPGISIYRGNKWRKSYLFMTSLHLHLFLSPISVMERREYLLVLIYFIFVWRRRSCADSRPSSWSTRYEQMSSNLLHNQYFTE